MKRIEPKATRQVQIRAATIDALAATVILRGVLDRVTVGTGQDLGTYAITIKEAFAVLRHRVRTLQELMAPVQDLESAE